VACPLFLVGHKSGTEPGQEPEANAALCHGCMWLDGKSKMLDLSSPLVQKSDDHIVVAHGRFRGVFRFLMA
jgi:hypothetical protein